MQYLVILGLITFIYFYYFKKKPLPHEENHSKSSKPQSSDMVKCSSCEIYCEISESLLSQGKYYCSPECMEKK